MMDSSLLAQGVTLLVTGMTTVIVFLTLLVIMTRFMSALVRRFLPEPPPESTHPSDDPTLVAVITAAIQQYRRDNHSS